MVMGFLGAKMAAGMLLLCCCSGFFVQMATAQLNSTFFIWQDLYQPQWGGQHIDVLNGGEQVDLILDATSGAGFVSSQNYTYGYFSMSMKLVQGYSAGVVTSFFLTSQGGAHDEIDFEFLGNVTGQPYSLQTNMFTNGTGGREQKLDLWFDPTADFHFYSLIWNHAQILWYVDNQLVRVFKNLESMGIAYPSTQQMEAIASHFDGSPWATVGPNGGMVPVNYTYAPFVAGYSEFQIIACDNNGIAVPECSTDWQNNWWESSQYTNLTSQAIANLTQIYQKYVIYDYCKDTKRYPNPPTECAYNYVN